MWSVVVFLSCAQAGPLAQATRNLAPPPARMDPNVYFVDPVRGSDEGSGRTSAHPWRTLTYAFPHAVGGPGVVLLAPGEYSEASGERFPLRPLGYQVIS